MSVCDLVESPDVELYFYGDLDHTGRVRIDAHLRVCGECRQRLEDLRAIRRALAERPAVDAPPAGDWSGFMRRLDAASGLAANRPVPTGQRRQVRAGQVMAVAATLALISIGMFLAARFRAATAGPDRVMVAAVLPAPVVSISSNRSLRGVSVEHLERSKLVILGLATRDPRDTRAADWQYERQLAGALLSDTRLYRLAAQDRGLSDVARVMGDLETVLLEASMSDTTDREALEHVQRLITKRGLVAEMRAVAIAGSAGI